jgi:hypothetical protein
MKKQIVVAVLLSAMILQTPVFKGQVSANNWTNSGSNIFNTGNVFTGTGSSFTGAGNFSTREGIREDGAKNWLTFLQPNYNSKYSFHNAAGGSIMELSVLDGTSGETHWQVMGVVRNGDIKFGYEGDPVNIYHNGTFKTKQIIVSNQGWADYVFEDGYKLMSLEEVEKFVNENNHLPNIPSAKTIEEQGLSVADMQRLQMEKIEELTLYLIEKDKQIDSLEERLQRLEALFNI